MRPPGARYRGTPGLKSENEAPTARPTHPSRQSSLATRMCAALSVVNSTSITAWLQIEPLRLPMRHIAAPKAAAGMENDHGDRKQQDEPRARPPGASPASTESQECRAPQPAGSGQPLHARASTYSASVSAAIQLVPQTMPEAAKANQCLKERISVGDSGPDGLRLDPSQNQSGLMGHYAQGTFSRWFMLLSTCLKTLGDLEAPRVAESPVKNERVAHDTQPLLRSADCPLLRPRLPAAATATRAPAALRCRRRR